MPPVKGNRDKRAGSQQASSSRNVPTTKVNKNGLTDEAAELTHLNNSLLSYVEYNQKLETENLFYKKELKTIQETTSAEVKRIQELYESKVKELQKTIDNDALEKAKIEIDFASVYKELEELKDLMKKADLKLHNYNDICKRNEKLVTENEQNRKEIEELNRTVQKLTKTNAAQKKNLEAETLSRIEIENKLQTVNETLAFRDQMIQDAFHEFYSRKERVEISETDATGSGAANSQSEDWQLSLEDLREKFNTDILHNRDNMKNLYINKLDYYESTIRKNTQMISELNAKSGNLETTNSVLSHRIAELEKKLTDERNCNKANKEMYESEIVSLREELNRQLQVYQSLMEDKMKIDLEIAAYRKVLEAEETRLNISLTNTVVEEADAADEFAYGPPSKRKRTAGLDESEVELSHSFNVSSSAKGPIQIVDVCKNGSYVKIKNKNNEELNLNGWQVVRTVGDDEMIYKFGRNSKIDANATITIWSSNSNQTQELPNTLVMKNQNWLMGDKFLTEIKSNNDEITANFEVTKVVRTRSKLRRRFGASRFGTAEELFHQRGDPSNTDKRNFCSIM